MALPTVANVNPGDAILASEHNIIADNVNQLGEGFTFVQTVTFSSSGTFTKATYPWLRAVRVKLIGGGGGGAGCGTTAGVVGMGRGGNGAVYAESFITDIAGLDASVTVTVGAGGAGGAAGSNAGTAGGTSSFGALVSATGGSGGGTQDFSGSPIWNVGVSSINTTGTGDLVIPGKGNDVGWSFTTTAVVGPRGGDSHWGTGGLRRLTFGSNQGNNGDNAYGFGAGGSGGVNSESTGTARSGGNGSIGRVLVELYA